MGEEIPWSQLFQYRDQIHQRYPSIWNLKILRKRFSLIRDIIRDGQKVLDVGASHRNLEPRIKAHFPNVVYKSLDIDKSQVHDFYSLDDVDETFDVVLLFEVIEHLELKEGVEMLSKIYSLLEESGRLILTTPNVFNPTRFWRDATHKMAYCYDELAGILLGQGFKIISMYRTYNDAFHRFLFRVYIMAALHRYLGIDFAKSILIVAEKESNG
ncbi:MAG: methyltransferase domain-containing protein [Proteobacteria bacterium]|nr:methyltransferase domain-containing protein [Pseudomonadota bacterium]NIS72491.1 methyltransferase domain-containing protein [Pseudomonadota bacterium]